MNVGYIALVWYKQCGKIQEVIFMHRVNEKQLLSSNNGINIYRGCTHGCIYCNAQSRCRRHLHIIIYTQSVFKRDSIFQLYMLQIRKQKRNGYVPFLLHYINFNYAAVAFSLFEASAVAASSFVELDCEELSDSESLYLSISSFEDFS